MRPILNCSPDSLEVNALFVQPTYDCAGNCKGCYVKARNQNQQISVLELVNMLWRFIKKRGGCWANQITCSIDENDPTKGTKSLEFFNETLHILRTASSLSDKPKVHFTCKSIETIKQYTIVTNPAQHVGLLDMISFSTIKQSDIPNIIKLKPLVDVNYNHLIPANITSQNIAEYVENIAKIGENVHSIYLIINKDPQGIELNQEEFAIARAKLIHDIAVINTLREKLPKSVWKKCNIDGCLQDIRRSRRTGYGCSSNVSRFQVWPDGSVSGCPYAASGVGEGRTKTVQDILENIKEARATYDFRERCTLREIYNSITR